MQFLVHKHCKHEPRDQLEINEDSLYTRKDNELMITTGRWQGVRFFSQFKEENGILRPIYPSVYIPPLHLLELVSKTTFLMGKTYENIFLSSSLSPPNVEGFNKLPKMCLLKTKHIPLCA